MLKISIVETRKERRLILNGSLISPWAAELNHTYDKAKADLNGRELIIKLDDITTISQEGGNVLMSLMNKGIKIRCRGVFTKVMVRQLARRARNDFQGAAQ